MSRLKHISGGDSLSRKLRSLPESVRAEIRPMMQKSANELEGTTRALVRNVTGKLAGTIEGKVDGDGLGFEVSAGGSDPETIIQAHTLEGGRRPDAQTGGMAALPFINPAKRLMIKRIRGRITRAVNKAAKRVAGGGG